MSDKDAFGFGAFVPGFDFLQGLVQSAAQGSPQAAPDWSKWVAPTLQAEEIEKRVNELKTVQFWLEQNARALAATIQALEVQKMTLATLRGMNVQVNDLASAFGFGKGAGTPAPAPAPGAGPYDDMFTHRAAERPAAAPDVAPERAEAPSPEPRPAEASAAAAAPPAVDPLQWWNALAGQFQQIAAGAMQEAAAQARQNPAGLQGAALQAFDAAGRMAAEVAAAALPTAKRPGRKAPASKKPVAATKPAARAAAKTAKPVGKAVKKAAATPQAAVRRKR